MSALRWVDGRYADLCATLAGPLGDEARRLPFTLGLAPDPRAPWSRVFSHEVTLAAPGMFADRLWRMPREAVEHAVLAHALAVIAAMGADRMEDGQARRTPALLRVLAAVRAARDEHLALAAGCEASAARSLASRADWVHRAALAAEREVLAGGRGVGFLTYEALGEHKQAPGLVATIVLTTRAGWSEAQVAAARRTLLDVALALQLQDDVVDWEDDAAEGRAWALALARRCAPVPWRPAIRGDDAAVAPALWRGLAAARADRAGMRALVHGSGVLPRMLRKARLRFRAASQLGAALGAPRLAAWADERARAVGGMAQREALHAGWVYRAQALAPWAHAVLGGAR